jgi:hypothetical protein
MKGFNDMKTYTKLASVAGVLALTAAPAAAIDYSLAAKAFTKTLPDGSPVPMWGYVLDPDTDGTGIGDCYEAGADGSADPARQSCIDALPDPVLPGPMLSVPPGESLTVYLSNGLPEPTSLVIPGQKMPVSGPEAAPTQGPTWNDGSTGARDPAADPPQRVRSFGVEAPAAGGAERYSFALERSGTFLYHSGTHPQKQVYMGLTGAGARDAEPGVAYPSVADDPPVAYDQEVVLFYSEIDPELNAAINELYNPTGTVAPYTTSVGYHPRWFLINGEPYVEGVTADIPLGPEGSTTLLRFASTAGDTHVPVLQGMHVDIHAENGLQYTWQDGAVVAGAAPRSQYSVELWPLMTKDATVTVPAPGRYAVYDGDGYMTNPSDVNDFTVGDTVGGMLRFLSAEEAPPPEVVLYLSLNNDTGTLVGLGPDGTDLAYADEDILSWNGTNYDMVFDGSAAGLDATADIYAFDVDLAGGLILMAFSADTIVPGLGIVTGSDIVAYSIGTGGFVPVFDGSDVGLTTVPNEYLDALQVLPDGTLAISTQGSVSVPGFSAADEDLLVFTPSSLGLNTSGSWAPGFDGSDVGLATSSGEDVDAVAVAASGDVYLSTVGDFSVTGLAGQDEDVFVCTPSSLGATTACTFTPFFDGTAFGLSADDVDGIDLP